MNTSVVDPVVGKRRWELLYAPILDEMRRAEELLKSELRSRHPSIDAIVQHSFRLGGKRLRPALLLLTAKACGGVSNDHLVLAAVVEMIHTATLLHDDVLDEAAVRRHLPTVNANWGVESSVLSGDYLFTHSFYLASTLETTFACQAIGKSTNAVCEGELLQIHSRGNFALTEAEYYEIIDAKTAQLTACCCELGAHYAGASPATVAALREYGRLLGLAFQIADDLLDVSGDESAAGKSLGTDLEKQKMTLPLIRALAQLSPADRATVVGIMQDDADGKRERLAPWLAKTGAIEYAQEHAQRTVVEARRLLEGLPDGDAKLVLLALTKAVVERKE